MRSQFYSCLLLNIYFKYSSHHTLHRNQLVQTYVWPPTCKSCGFESFGILQEQMCQTQISDVSKLKQCVIAILTGNGMQQSVLPMTPLNKNTIGFKLVLKTVVDILNICYNGATENARLENDGPSKGGGWKMQDWNLADQIAGLENAGPGKCRTKRVRF